MLRKIISGMQTGVDRAAVEVAQVHGFKTGGYMPKGYLALDGKHPEFADQYSIVESHSEEYGIRTDQNVEQSDATLQICSHPNSPGERRTTSAIAKFGKPFSIITLGRHPDGGFDVISIYCFDHKLNANDLGLYTVACWLDRFETVNVAGNSERTSKGIYSATNELMEMILTALVENR